MNTKFYYIGLFIVIVGCTHTTNVKNERKGKLTAKYQLVVGSEKRIWLDYETAPQPPFMQMVTGNNGNQILTFFNRYKYSIYLYDYEKDSYIGKIKYEREGPNGINYFGGYYIKNMDSVYVYNRLLDFVLTDSSGIVKKRISLNSENMDWALYHPLYEIKTINPMVERKGKLVLSGMAPFSVADSLIRKFRFTTCVDFKSNSLEYIHTYPEELYGFDANWQDPFYTQPYLAFSPNGEWLYSFPVSHNLYIANEDTEGYQTVYAGSNVAGTISSIIDGKIRTDNETILTNILQQDLYTAILHDKWRSVYYRFMLQGIPDATVKNNLTEKPIVVIIMDEKFNYLGETVIGTGKEWNYTNSFVTTEGLVMEYIDQGMDFDEQYLILKTFILKGLKDKE